jgi:hypothetical protein
MVKVTEKTNGYMIELEADETIEILINSTSVFSQTIGTDKKAQATFNLQETIVPPAI